MRSSDIDSALAQICAGLDALRDCNITALTSVELTALLAEVEVVRRRFEPLDQTLLGEVVTRGVAQEYARTSPVDLLVELLRVRPGEAKARLTRAAELGPRCDLQRQPLCPILPVVSAAVAAGELSGDHANVIIAATREIPDEHEGRFDDLVETTLVDQARHGHPGHVAKAAVMLLQRLDPDGRPPKDEEHQRRREFGLRANADGSHSVMGRLTPECGAVWHTILDSLAKPQPAADGTHDPRSAGQRGHDALLDAGQRLLRADLPDTGGTPITLMVTMHLDDLLAGTGTATARPAVTTHVDSGAQRRPQLTAQDAMAGSSSRSVDGSGTTDRGTREGADCDGRRPRQRDRTRPPHSGRTPSPPRHRLDRPRPHRHRQPHPPVRLPPPQLRSPRLVLPHERRHPPLDATSLARPRTTTTQEHRPPPRDRLRHRIDLKVLDEHTTRSRARQLTSKPVRRLHLSLDSHNPLRVGNTRATTADASAHPTRLDIDFDTG